MMFSCKLKIIRSSQTDRIRERSTRAMARPRRQEGNSPNPAKLQNRMGAYYIVTDLVIRARFDFAALHDELLRAGLFGSQPAPPYRGIWQNGYSGTKNGCRHPSEAVDELAKIVENLTPEARDQWNRCISRRFDMGFQGQDEPFHAKWLITTDVLKRVTSVNGELAISIYRPERSADIIWGPNGPIPPHK